METKAFMSTIIFLVVGIVLFPIIQGMIGEISSANEYTTYRTANSTMSDYFPESVYPWENVATDREAIIGANGNVVLGSSGGAGSVVWSQELEVPSLQRGVSSAEIVAKYWLIENDEIATLTVEFLIGENVLWTRDNIETNAPDVGWGNYILIECDVAEYIVGTGTYSIIMSDEITVSNEGDVLIGWDDAYLSVTVYDYKYSGMWLTLLELVPMFYVLGLVFVVITFAITKVKGFK